MTDTSTKKKQTLFIAGLPHTQMTAEYVSCAYTMKARKLTNMMVDEGYKVFVLASRENDSKGELLTCITKADQKKFFGDNNFKKFQYNITWDPADEHWRLFNKNIIKHLTKYLTEHPDEQVLFCHFAGWCMHEVTAALSNFPNLKTVEAGIGYEGVYSDYKVWESNSHMHWVYGMGKVKQGHFYDVVIPNYWDESEFTSYDRAESAPYAVFIGRMNGDKGFAIAQQVCEKLGIPLKLAGQLSKGQIFTGYGEHIGTVDTEGRKELLGHASVVFTPSLYIEPFGGTHVEAQLSGAPVMTTPFGVYSETVIDYKNGVKCYDFQDFLEGTRWALSLSAEDREGIREYAIEKWAMKNVAKQYDRYFNRLLKNNWYGEG